VACAESRRCQSAQELCIGKDNADKFSTKDKKRLCECVVDFYLCSLDTAGNKSSCQVTQADKMAQNVAQPIFLSKLST
jgi:hypothetical protein